MSTTANNTPASAPAPADKPRLTEYPPLQGGSIVLGTIALALATFMNVLDTTIANVSIPAISGDLGVSPTQGTWVITSFAVSNAISVPLTGWLTQRFGQVRLFISSVVLFVIASWLCGLAPSIEALIFFRIVQGAVAGPMIPLSQTLLLASYPKSKAGLALAMWGITTLVAPVVGPLLGGWITDYVSWPWIFYINIPVGLGAALVTWNIFKDRESPTRILPIDKVGLGLLVVWVGSLQVMLDKGKELDWFASNQIVILGVVALVAFAFFIVWELTDKHPVVDLSLFKGRNFWTGTVALSLGYGLFFGNVVLMPLWLQQWMGYTAIQAGAIMAPVGVFAILLSPLVGKKVATVDPRKLISVAFVVFAIVLWMRSDFNTQADFTTLIIPTVVQGVAMAFFFIPLVSLTLSGLSPTRIPAASGLSNFTRILAGGIGTSIVTTIWEDRATMHHAHLAESINVTNGAANQAIAGLQAQGMTSEQAYAQITRLIDQQAYMLSANDIFYASAIAFVFLIGVVWLARPKMGAPASAEAAGAH